MLLCVCSLACLLFFLSFLFVSFFVSFCVSFFFFFVVAWRLSVAFSHQHRIIFFLTLICMNFAFFDINAIHAAHRLFLPTRRSFHFCHTKHKMKPVSYVVFRQEPWWWRPSGPFPVWRQRCQRRHAADSRRFLRGRLSFKLWWRNFIREKHHRNIVLERKRREKRSGDKVPQSGKDQSCSTKEVLCIWELFSFWGGNCTARNLHIIQPLCGRK